MTIKGDSKQARHTLDSSILSTIIGTKGRKTIEDDMHGLLLAYNEMLGKDLKMPEIKERDFVDKIGNAINKFRENRRERNTSTVETTEDSGKQQSFFASMWQRKLTNQMDTVKEDNSNLESAISDGDQIVTFASNHVDANNARQTTTQLRQSTANNYQSLTKSIWKRHYSSVPPGAVKEHVGVNEIQNVRDMIFLDPDQTMTENKLLDLMERALKTCVQPSANFMAEFFKPGSVSELMVKSTAKVVWLNDWYPLRIASMPSQ
mmetsp:Transcript_57538/g.68695  ORF Transcript_57538/g.68695 Transcript_57538/m.68695 type:complete len:262 (+) Transcript_57538:96-881(+)|eukprot:CAMPEP_0172479836 /NCGR_PEP_ID=MMETSP1066-20121228/4656_1 /TAXON_ID=671091 /ORGANISM="Coscinodiscus wailesii, Strain CCMP2513" /LENGTH=261 /DNA_ID=CAMNT_0013240641 /DNA_START=231 /DNA_END=1016 /DNA_ORIENTATION=-